MVQNQSHMTKFIFTFIAVLVCFSIVAQNDVTKFMGIPVDGSKTEMIKMLKSKGFHEESLGGHDFLLGRFNGEDVHVFLAQEKDKVYRIMVSDINTRDSNQIKVRYNNLVHQLNNNGKYVSFDSLLSIPEDENFNKETSQLSYDN